MAHVSHVAPKMNICYNFIKKFFLVATDILIIKPLQYFSSAHYAVRFTDFLLVRKYYMYVRCCYAQKLVYYQPAKTCVQY